MLFSRVFILFFLFLQGKKAEGGDIFTSKKEEYKPSEQRKTDQTNVNKQGRKSREERNNRRNKQGESGAPFDAEGNKRGGRGAGRGGGKNFEP